ncbi:hypothetical protein MNBD_ALPHA03-1417, partial [hydrothermal vent metagenome]
LIFVTTLSVTGEGREWAVTELIA